MIRGCFFSVYVILLQILKNSLHFQKIKGLMKKKKNFDKNMIFLYLVTHCKAIKNANGILHRGKIPGMKVTTKLEKLILKMQLRNFYPSYLVIVYCMLLIIQVRL